MDSARRSCALLVRVDSHYAVQITQYDIRSQWNGILPAVTLVVLVRAGRANENEFFEIGAFLIGLSALFGFLNHKCLFLLVGLEVLVIAQRADHIGVALLLIPVTLLARFVTVSVPITSLSRWRSFTKGAIPILTWGGLRGGIAVAGK